MSNKRLWAAILAFAAFGPAASAAQTVPGMISYQGRIRVSGTDFNGTGQFKFALVNTDGSAVYWSNDGSAGGEPANAVSLPVAQGLYSVLLGDSAIPNMVPIPAAVFRNSDVRLRIWFSSGGSFQQLAPDQRIAAVGYAMMAAAVSSGDASSGMTLQADGTGGATWGVSQGIQPTDGNNIVAAVNNAATTGTINNNRLTNSALTVSAGTGLSGGGTVSLGGSTTLSLDTPVSVANGGTGATTQQAALNALAGSMTSGQYLRGTGAKVAMSAIQAVDVPILNQNTTGSSGSCTGNAATATTAGNVTGTVAVANGGTGATTLGTSQQPLLGNGTSAVTASAAPTTNDTHADAIIGTSAVTQKGLVIQGQASQSANLQEWQSSTGGVLASIGPAGLITGNGSGLANLTGANVIGNISGNAASVTGMVAVLNGGTGLSAAGTAGNFLRSNGTNWASSPIQGTDLPSSTLATNNPLQVALLRWYPAIQTGKTYTVGSQPWGVAFDGANIWVANTGAGGPSTVTKLLASTGATVGTYTVGRYPTGVAFDGANIWVTNSGDNTVTKLLASTGATVGTYTMGSQPWGVAFDGANIWVVNRADNTVTKLLASTGATVGTYEAGTGPAVVAFDGANIWVVNRDSNNVTKLLASTGATVGTYNVGSFPWGMAFDGANIWVANYSGNSVTKLRASDGATVGTYTVGSGPIGVAFDGAYTWVANESSNNVTKLLASTGATVGTYAVGSGPFGVAFDGTNIWVTNCNDGTVSKL